MAFPGPVAAVTLLAALFADSPSPTVRPSARPPLALVGGKVYADPGGAPIFDAVVVVADGKVSEVGPRATVVIPKGAAVVDCAGTVLTAGFQNSHVHFTEEKWAGAARQDPARLSENLTAMLTRFGFTTVVDTASSLGNTVALRRRIESGEIAGPRILTAGDALFPPKGIPFYVRETLPAAVVEHLPQPSTPAEAVTVVRGHREGGADLIKLFTGSWVARGKVLPMPKEIATAAAAAMHEGGGLVFAHASNVAGLQVALDAGVDVLAHATEDLRGLTQEHRARMRRQNVALIPTLKLFGGDRWLFEIMDEVREYARSGGRILFGTDVGYLTDYDPTDEYVRMASAGLGWREILASLTTSPAERFSETATRGRIAPGQRGDLVVLEADPARDVRAFANVRHTIREECSSIRSRVLRRIQRSSSPSGARIS